MKRYTDFEIWIEPPKRKRRKQYPVHSFSSLAGPASGSLTLDLEDQTFKNELSVVRSEGPDLVSRQAFGRKLFDALFCGKVRDAWMTSRGRLAAGEADGLRLRLAIDDAQVAELPWELLYEDGGGFLATPANVALSRYLPVPEPPTFTIRDKLRVLVVVESPSNLSTIQEQEVENLRAALTGLGNAVEHKILRDLAIPQIQSALQQQDYHVLHFLGHGWAGKLALVRAGGTKAECIDDQEFAQVVQGRTSLRLIVLNACHSSQPARGELFAGMGPALVKMQMPAVVAMQYNMVAVDTAGKFNSAFYGALANGIAVDFAVSEARKQLSAGPLLAHRDWSTPVLYMGTRQGRIWSTKADERKWSRPMVAIPIEENRLEELAILVGEIRQDAQGVYAKMLGKRQPPSKARTERVRVNVFLPDMREVEDTGDVCDLFIPRKLHHGIDAAGKERDIRFRPNQGLTGIAYAKQRPLAARRPDVRKERKPATSEWKLIDLEQRKGSGSEDFGLTDVHKDVMDKRLRWIISFPLKAAEQGPTLGVLNIDGLVVDLQDDELRELYNALRVRVGEFAARLSKLPKQRVTISVETIDDPI